MTTRPATVELRGDTLVITYGGWVAASVIEPVSVEFDNTAPAWMPSHSTAVAHYRCCDLGMCSGHRRNYDGNGRKNKVTK